MKKFFLFLIVVFCFLSLSPKTYAQNGSFCPDNSSPPQYNQAIGSSYKGGNGVIYKCELVNGVATWVAQKATIFSIPNFGGFFNLSNLIDVLIQLAFFIAGLFFFFNLIIGGIQWINAGGDPKALTSARARITNAMIGLIIVVAAYAITGIVGSVFGISIIGGFRFRTP